MNQPPPPPDPTWPPPAYAAPPPMPFYDRDADHLRLLSIFYYIWGGLTLLGSCMFLFYFFMGLAMKSAPSQFTSPGQTPAPAFVGNVFALIGLGGLIVGWALGGLTLYAGYCLARCKNMVLILVAAALNCLSIPLGTILGVFTFIVTNRPTVKAMFDAGSRA